MNDDLTTDLRALANRWALLARDYARDAKAVDATDAQVNYRKGIADGYYKAATELADLLKRLGSGASASGASLTPAAGGKNAAPNASASAPFTMMGNGGMENGVGGAAAARPADPHTADPQIASARTQPLTDEMKAVRQARSTGSNPAVVADPPAQPAPTWEKVSMSEVLSILSYAGTNVRDITENKDNSFLLVFSSWENIMPHVRVERIQKADLRVVVLKSGKLKETNDPFIELAFKPI